ncbi:MAG: hypothetical protein Q7S92_06110, partial [Candidatus Diapherotrites archaeon]|nr:hypothetical protein [Candidatus Diapherotrites archaeon]
YSLDVITVDGLAKDLTRNGIIDTFLSSKSEYLFFLSTDTIFPADTIDLLMKSEKDIISALTFTNRKVRPTFLMKKDGKYSVVEKIENMGQVLEVDAVGMDCYLIKKEVFEKIDKKNKDQPFFKTDYKNRKEFVSEDIYFSELVKKAGYSIHVDTRLIVGKTGSIAPEAIFRDYFR